MSDCDTRWKSKLHFRVGWRKVDVVGRWKAGRWCMTWSGCPNSLIRRVWRHPRWRIICQVFGGFHFRRRQVGGWLWNGGGRRRFRFDAGRRQTAVARAAYHITIDDEQGDGHNDEHTDDDDDQYSPPRYRVLTRTVVAVQRWFDGCFSSHGFI